MKTDHVARFAGLRGDPDPVADLAEPVLKVDGPRYLGSLGYRHDARIPPSGASTETLRDRAR